MALHSLRVGVAQAIAAMGARTAGFLAGGLASVAAIAVAGYFNLLRVNDATTAHLSRVEVHSRQPTDAMRAAEAFLAELERPRAAQ